MRQQGATVAILPDAREALFHATEDLDGVSSEAMEFGPESMQRKAMDAWSSLRRRARPSARCPGTTTPCACREPLCHLPAAAGEQRLSVYRPDRPGTFSQHEPVLECGAQVRHRTTQLIEESP